MRSIKISRLNQRERTCLHQTKWNNSSIKTRNLVNFWEAWIKPRLIWRANRNTYHEAIAFQKWKYRTSRYSEIV